MINELFLETWRKFDAQTLCIESQHSEKNLARLSPAFQIPSFPERVTTCVSFANNTIQRLRIRTRQSALFY